MGTQNKDLDDDHEYHQPPPVVTTSTPALKVITKTISMQSVTVSDGEPDASSYDDLLWTHRLPGGKYSYTGGPPPWVQTEEYTNRPPQSVWVTTYHPTALADGGISTQVAAKQSQSTAGVPSPSFSPGDYGSRRPDWHAAKDRMSSGGLLAATAITPIVVLALIGGLVFLCMRKRKRQKVENEFAHKVQEMRMQPREQPTARPYMAPTPAASADHLMPPSNPSVPPPIILGPIPSGANGAYFTGIDTSDVISMISARSLRPAPPNFSDNESIAEPPPPYRPRSVAPPSLTNTSRHSSFRASMAPPTTSRTQLIERSPFDDPEDDDMVSDLSGPTAGCSDDAMSAVSDMSYQHDPVVYRSSV
jgi:hypothetical protein